MYSAGGSYLGKFGSQGSGPGQFNTIVGMVVDGTGNLSVLDHQTTGDRIQVLDNNGTYLRDFSIPDCETTGNPSAGGLSADHSGAYFGYRCSGYPRTSACGLKFDGTGQLVCSWPLSPDPAPAYCPRDTGVDAEGNVYLLDADGFLYKFTPGPEPVLPTTWSAIKALRAN